MARVRVAAARCVQSVWQQHQSLAEVLPLALEQVPARDKGLLQAMVYQTIRHFYELEALANGALSKPMRNKDSDVFCLLLVGLCQIRLLSIPDHAAVDATVGAAKLLKKQWAAGLINAILRKAARGHLRADFPETALYNHPTWLLERLQSAWPEHWQQIAQANQHQGPMTLRINPAHCARENYLQQLSAAGIAARPTEFSDVGVTLDEATEVTGLPGFEQGWVSVQDEAAQMASAWLDPQPGDRVLDACAAPGGKTGHLLELMHNSGELVALDASGKRLARVEENLTRLGLHARLKQARAESLEDWWDHKPFDRILLDAPCSGTGVIRRHPDIKLLRQLDDVGKLVILQQALLQTLWQTLKPGGILLYATCSVLPEENEQQVEAFLTRNEDARLLELPVNHGLQRPFGQQWLPQRDGADGFYYARLQKQS